jgi:hypothetical protein
MGLMRDHAYEHGFVEVDRLFHTALVRLSDNERLIRLYEQVPLPLIIPAHTAQEIWRQGTDKILLIIVDFTSLCLILNPPPPEGGGFAEAESYGLKAFAHGGATRKLSPPSPGSTPSCSRMYAITTSSVTFPLDATKYPRAQR